MPFAVTKSQGAGLPKLYLRSLHEEHVWTATKRDALRLDEAQADKLARDINLYASTPAEVEGIAEQTL